jgi:hypothetical protein
MGITNATKKIWPPNVSTVTIEEEDKTEMRKLMDTIGNLIEPVDLIMLPIMINDLLVDVRLDPGALASIVPLSTELIYKAI